MLSTSLSRVMPALFIQEIDSAEFRDNGIDDLFGRLKIGDVAEILLDLGAEAL